MNIPPAPFKGGDGTVNIQEYHNCISYLYIILIYHTKAIGCKIEK